MRLRASPALWAIVVPLVALPPVPSSAQILQYADRAPDRAEHVSGGLLVLFDAEGEGRWLNAVEVYGSGRGDPSLDFELYVVGLEGRQLRRISLPPIILVGDDDWRMLPLPPMKVPQEFGVGLVFPEGVGSGYRGFGTMLAEPLHYGRYHGGYMGYSSGDGILARVGQYAPVEESHSYTWRPGQAGEGLWDREWMLRAYVSDTPDGDPEATDLVVLNTGEAFFDRVTAAGGEPLDVQTAAHGRIPREEIASVRMMAVSSPAASDVRIVLANGRTVEGMLDAVDDDTVRVRDAVGRLISIARAEVDRVGFTGRDAVAIAAQAEPSVSGTRRAWGPEQATGPPDVDGAGDSQLAWATKDANAGLEWLLLTYETAVDIAEVRVHENDNPGAVSRITAILEDNTEVELWEGQDPSTNAPAEFVVEVAEVVRARKIKVYLDTTRKADWNEIDAVELIGKDGSRQWASDASASSTWAER